MNYSTNQIGVHCIFSGRFINGLLYLAFGASDKGDETCDLPVESELVGLDELGKIAGMV